ncbi:MAG: beta-phosphoglucomutase [Roseiflexaceae bacterium]
MTTSAVRAVLWDMDGTLVDSADYHSEAWRMVMEPRGVFLTDEMFTSTFGQRNDTILRIWLGEQTTDATIREISDAKEARYREIVAERGIALLPGTAERIDHLHATGWRQAIASAAPRANVEAIIHALGLDRVMAGFVGAEDVARGKPDPEVFLRAAEKLGVPPQQCIVVEDAPAGVEAGKRAGMRVIGVGPNSPHLPADRAAFSLADLPADLFESLLEA